MTPQEGFDLNWLKQRPEASPAGTGRASFFEAIPEITTARLRLRAHRGEDFPASTAMWAKPEVTRFIGGGKPLSKEESWARFLRYAGHWAWLGFGYWVIEEQAGGCFAGEIGFAHFQREIEPPLRTMPELGWVLAPPFQGRGYATEAVRAALEWGRSNLLTESIACLIHPDNEASIRVADKCGFQKYCQTTYKNQPTVLFMRGNW